MPNVVKEPDVLGTGNSIYKRGEVFHVYRLVRFKDGLVRLISYVIDEYDDGSLRYRESQRYIPGGKRQTPQDFGEYGEVIEKSLHGTVVEINLPTFTDRPNEVLPEDYYG